MIAAHPPPPRSIPGIKTARQKGLNKMQVLCRGYTRGKGIIPSD